MKKSKIILLTLLSSTLFACANENSSESPSSESNDSQSSTTPSSSEETLPENYNSSVKNYLKALKNLHNYSLTETVSSTAATYENQIEAKYTESYYYYDFGQYTNGYIASDDGVYQISLKDDSLVGGELVRDSNGDVCKNIWEGNLFKNFSNLDDEQLDKIEDGLTNVSITGKKNKVAILNILGLNSSYYGGITSFKGSIGSSNELGISIEIADASGATIYVDAVVYGLLTSKSTEVEEFLANGGTYFTIDSEFAKARELMKANNYTHNYYNNKSVVGVEYFNENYYFINWDSNYVKETGEMLYSQGMIGIDHKKDKNGNELNGSYLVTLSSSGFSISISRPYNESPNIPYVYHYPSYMDMWDNPEFFDMDTTPSDLDVYFTTTDSLIMTNFIENFSMESQVAQVKIRSLSIGWKDIEDESEDTSRIIRFCLSTSGGDVTYDFSNFGTTELPALDNYLDSLVDQ